GAAPGISPAGAGQAPRLDPVKAFMPGGVELEFIPPVAEAVEQPQSWRKAIGQVTAREPLRRAQLGPALQQLAVSPARLLAPHGIPQCAVAGVAVEVFQRRRLVEDVVRGVKGHGEHLFSVWRRQPGIAGLAPATSRAGSNSAPPALASY